MDTLMTVVADTVALNINFEGLFMVAMMKSSFLILKK